MVDLAIARVEDLARTDPVAAPLAMLMAEALKAAASEDWSLAVPDFYAGTILEGMPLLGGTTIALNPAPARALLRTLMTIGGSGAMAGPDRTGDMPDPLALIEASINQDGEQLAALAAGAGMDERLLATLGQLVALPLLMACGRRAEPLVRAATWEHGYCPVCAAWPTMSEVRGTERERWLHCGRCGTEWPWAHLKCAFCGNDDHLSQGYLAPELLMESRRTTTCESCRGYLKGTSSLVAMTPAEVLLADLTTLEMDVAAMERGYERPGGPPVSLSVRVVAG